MDPAIPFNTSVNRNEDENTDNETKFSDESDFESESSDESVNSEVKENDDHVQFGPFFKAFQEKDWNVIEEFITKNPQALTAKIKVYGEDTVLHIITRNLDVPLWLVEKLASMVSPESLEHLTDGFGCSVLSCAAANRNTKAAEVFVRRNTNLPNISNHRSRLRFLPIHDAAMSGHKETIQYLLRVTTVPLDDERGVSLLDFLISSRLYGMAFDLMKRYPNLARERHQDRRRILVILANDPLAFESGSQLSYWKRLIYCWIPVQDDRVEPCPQSVDGDIENTIKRSKTKKLRKFTHLGYLQQISTVFGTSCKNFHIVFWNALMKLAPSIKCIRDTKLQHMQTHEIVKILCHEGVIWSNKQALESLCTPLLTAAKLGICEIVDEILKAYYYSYTFVDMNTRHSVLQLSILHRQEKVFSLLNKTNFFSRAWNVVNVSAKAENILHLAARSKPNSSQASGAAAALQMQSELQWFKAVESYAQSSHQEQRNFSNITPRELFTKEHNNLFEEGKEWVKTTALWCSLVASVIIVIELVAAFNVPRANYYTERIPFFLQEVPFKVFAISNVLALSTSTASLLLFFGLIASRYSEQDFLESLPKKLIIGLITLFVSIASMVVAVGSTIYIFHSHPWRGAIIPISILGCLPLILFSLKGFPLLVEISSSTYGPGIFQPAKRRQKNL